MPNDTVIGDTSGGNTGATGGTGSAPPASGATPPAGSSTGGAQTWRDTLPDDLKNDPVVVNMPDVPTLVKSYKHAQSLVGKKGVYPPGEKATDEDYARFYKELGQPEYDKFEVKAPDGIPKEFVEGFRKSAHTAGMLPRQAQQVLDGILKMNQDSIAAQQTQIENQVKSELDGLRKEWGNDFDKMAKLGNMAARELGGAEFHKFMGESGLGRDVRIIKFLARVGQVMSETGGLKGGADGTGGQTKAEIQGSIDRLFMDPDYGTSSPRGHQLAAEMEKLMRTLHG